MFQTLSDVILILSSIGCIGLTISIVGTIFLLMKFNVSNTAWIYTALASIAFFLAGIIKVTFATYITIVGLSWATPLGLVGGYILILLAINQYLQDKRKILSRLSTFGNTETPVIEDVQ